MGLVAALRARSTGPRGNRRRVRRPSTDWAKRSRSGVRHGELVLSACRGRSTGVGRMEQSGIKYINPDSVLARTAWEMVQTHAGGLGPHDGIDTCPVCDEPLPCRAGRAAAEVLAAAGLAESSGLIEAARQGRSSPLGYQEPLSPPAYPRSVGSYGAPAESPLEPDYPRPAT